MNSRSRAINGTPPIVGSDWSAGISVARNVVTPAAADTLSIRTKALKLAYEYAFSQIVFGFNSRVVCLVI